VAKLTIAWLRPEYKQISTIQVEPDDLPDEITTMIVQICERHRETKIRGSARYRVHGSGKKDGGESFRDSCDLVLGIDQEEDLPHIGPEQHNPLFSLVERMADKVLASNDRITDMATRITNEMSTTITDLTKENRERMADYKLLLETRFDIAQAERSEKRTAETTKEIIDIVKKVIPVAIGQRAQHVAAQLAEKKPIILESWRVLAATINADQLEQISEKLAPDLQPTIATLMEAADEETIVSEMRKLWEAKDRLSPLLEIFDDEQQTQIGVILGMVSNIKD